MSMEDCKGDRHCTISTAGVLIGRPMGKSRPHPPDLRLRQRISEKRQVGTTFVAGTAEIRGKRVGKGVTKVFVRNFVALVLVLWAHIAAAAVSVPAPTGGNDDAIIAAAISDAAAANDEVRFVSGATYKLASPLVLGV